MFRADGLGSNTRLVPQKNGRARNRQRPLAAIVSLHACHKKNADKKVLEGTSQPSIALLSFYAKCGRPAALPAERFHSGLFTPDVGVGTELALPSAIARRRGPAHGASRPPHRAGRTQHTPSTAAQTPPQFNPQRHAGVTTWSASRSASRSAGRRTFRGRSPTRGRGQGRGGADDGGCPSAAARGGSGSHRVDEEDEPAPKRKKVMSRAARAWRRWVCGGRERTREWRCAFASLLAVCACAREAVIRSVRYSLFSVSMLLSSYES